MIPPNRSELLQFIDGTLEAHRMIEVRTCISASRTLQKEIELLRTLDTEAQKDLNITLSSSFADRVMKRLPGVVSSPIPTFVERYASYVLAFAIVVAVIATVFAATSQYSGLNPSVNILDRVSSVSDIYAAISGSVGRELHTTLSPIADAADKKSGRFFITGVIVFIIFNLIDSLYLRKYRKTRFRH